MTVTAFETAQRGVTTKDMLARAAYQVVASFENMASAFADFRERRKTANQLHALSDDMLRDIGLTRGEINQLTARR
ncbi:MAG: DUF1127 domain-containing protein [Alphaproteobacteria bacterium]|nr:DUF1127 domain-containing protein [Alphaproteobacteria bacterium]